MQFDRSCRGSGGLLGCGVDGPDLIAGGDRVRAPPACAGPGSAHRSRPRPRFRRCRTQLRRTSRRSRRHRASSLCTRRRIAMCLAASRASSRKIVTDSDAADRAGRDHPRRGILRVLVGGADGGLLQRREPAGGRRLCPEPGPPAAVHAASTPARAIDATKAPSTRGRSESSGKGTQDTLRTSDHERAAPRSRFDRDQPCTFPGTHAREW